MNPKAPPLPSYKPTGQGAGGPESPDNVTVGTQQTEVTQMKKCPSLPQIKPVKLPTKKLKEKDIEDAVCRYARDRGWYAVKFTSPNRRSVPDRLFITPKGRVVFIEFKAPGKVPTSAQNREIARLREYRQTVLVIDRKETGKKVIDILEANNGATLTQVMEPGNKKTEDRNSSKEKTP